MKARYLVIYLMCALTAICSCQRELPDGNGPSGSSFGQEIMFNPGITQKTKANNIISSTEELQAAGKNISLYGWTFVSNRSEPAFAINNQPLTFSGGTWDYAPHQYWIPSVDNYGFGAIWPYKPTRNDPIRVPGANPANDSFHADDVVRNVIVDVKPTDAYLTCALPDLIVGYQTVEPKDYGKTVNLPMEHAMSAFRVRVRNLTSSPIVLTNWYLVNLKCHIDLTAMIIGKNANGDASQVMTRIPDKQFVALQHAPVGQTENQPYDKIKLLGSDEWINCEDPSNSPNNYKYIVISQRLQETAESLADADSKRDAIKAAYAAMGYTNYSKNIYWGNDIDDQGHSKGMNDNHFFMPFAYIKGASMMDFNGDGIRDNEESGLRVRVYECRSHMYPSGDDYKANGGIYMPVTVDQEAILYSPYFSSSESFDLSSKEDWDETMGSIVTRSPSHYNDDGSYSIFRWDANNGSPTPPTNLSDAWSNYANGNGQYTASVSAGDLKTALNDDGYVLAFPQDVSNLEMCLTTAEVKGAPGAMEDVLCSSPVTRTVLFRQSMDKPEWKPGYKYDYVITISSDKIRMTLDIEPWKEKEITLD